MPSESLRIFRKWNRILHRDIGYFFFGLTIIYCISGIALNHKKDWHPSYVIKYQDIAINEDISKSDVTLDWVMTFLEKYNEEDHYKKHFFPDAHTLKIFIDDGSIAIDMKNKTGYIEKISKRPFFFEINFLHYNPGKWWTWFSDIFCLGLIIISITGLFIIAKSKNSLTRRGIWFILAGLVLPILALLIL